jgi:hypothetical protein
VLTGGRDATDEATACGTFCAARPVDNVVGKDLANPVTIKAKNTPIDNDVPAFWNVERIPDAAPRWFAGTLPMMDDVFGAENIP